MQVDITDIFDACRKGDLDRVKKIYDFDAESIHAEDHKGFTPLILAVYNDNAPVVQFLLEKGAKVDRPDLSGNSALMGVCFKGYKNITKMLIDAGVDVNQRNSNGATALTFAATFGHLEITEMLLKNGADIELRDQRGKSSLDHARLQENEAMIALIEKYVNDNGK